MGHLGIALEAMRSLILASNTWDYCVVWELGDDPSTSSCIQWVGCCCCGGGGLGLEEAGLGAGKMRMLCRDMFIPHPANTMACQALSKLPSTVPLSSSSSSSSGIHGEVVISSVPRWLHHVAHMSNSKGSDESITTQVLIPVLGGLVELFSAKNVSKNKEMVECLMTWFNHPSQMESFGNMSLLGQFTTTCWLPSLDQTSAVVPQPVAYFSSRDAVMIPLGEQSSSALGTHPLLLHSSRPEMAKLNEDVYSINFLGKERSSTGILRPNQERYRSKNLLPERNRRTRIREGLLELRAVVPKITKMDIASTLGDAINYIKELEGKVKELWDELKDLSETESGTATLDLQVSKLKRKCANAAADNNVVTSCQTQASSYNNMERQLLLEAHVEVNKLGTRDFLVKILWEHKRGSFTRLIEALTRLGLQVTDANVTSCNGILSNIIRVQATSNDIQAKKLREVLHKLASSSSPVLQGCRG